MGRANVCLWILLASASFACSDDADSEFESPDGCVDSDSDMDADTDTGTDADTDADSETGTDTGDPDVCADIECVEPYVVRVDVDVVSPGLGDTWETAFDKVQDGIERCYCLAQECEATCQVWVAEGVYHVYESSVNDTVHLRPGVEVYGGFVGTETSLDERDWETYVTTLDGRAEWSSSVDVYHVVIGSDDAVMDGFTITGGFADGTNDSDRSGGGMYNFLASPVVANCAFVDNAAGNMLEGGMGGGMYNSSSSPTVANCLFEGNGASWDGFGGGMYNHYSSPTVTNCTFLDSGAGEGSGMYNVDSDPTVTLCTFEDNWTECSGGGMHNEHSSPTVTDCVFEYNFVMKHGGGMTNIDSSPELTNCVFVGNEVADDWPFSSFAGTGGGMFNWHSAPLLTNCVFVDNVTFTEDDEEHDGSGGGICNADSSPTLTNCTFAGNSASHNGGGIYNSDGSAPVIENTVVWGNSADLSADNLLNSASTPAMSHNNIGGCGTSAVDWDEACGTDLGGNLDADPLFVDVDTDDLHLQAGSPCIDAADGTVAPEFDLDGNPRVDDPDTPNTGVGPPWADIGAYEFQP